MAKRKKTEFSKRLAIWAAIMATTSAAASYVLAAFDKATASDVTMTIFGACVSYLITYGAKSLGEKMSRNKHGLDANGLPYGTPGSQSDEDGDNN